MGSRPRQADSMLRQLAGFCLRGTVDRQILVTLEKSVGVLADVRDPPLRGVEVTIDGSLLVASLPDLMARSEGADILITVPVRALAARIASAFRLGVAIRAARYIDWFSEGHELDDTVRRWLALTERNCI